MQELKEITKVIPFFSPAKNPQFILYNNDTGKVRIYHHYYALNKDKVNTFYLAIVKEFTITNPKLITGNIHTAISTDYSKFLFFIDEKNMYKFNVVTGEIKTYTDQNIAGVQFLDNTFIYA